MGLHRLTRFPMVALIAGVLLVFSTGCSYNKEKGRLNRERNSMQDGQIVMPDGSKARQPIGEELKKKIDSWIKVNDRNEFGDPKDTMYTGGSPLFNELTGQLTDRYEYILENHPELSQP